jgi:hypothetical protein
MTAAAGDPPSADATSWRYVICRHAAKNSKRSPETGDILIQVWNPPAPRSQESVGAWVSDLHQRNSRAPQSRRPAPQLQVPLVARPRHRHNLQRKAARFRRPSCCVGGTQHRGQIASQLDPELALLRHQDDRIDQPRSTASGPRAGRSPPWPAPGMAGRSRARTARRCGPRCSFPLAPSSWYRSGCVCSSCKSAVAQ